MQPSSDRMDDESKKVLLDVKKGKPRKFVMIKDGVGIDRMHIFKKGPFERYVRLAKQQGVRGEAYWGIVRGEGLDIFFELSRSDGFASPPGTPIRLKEFLKETTGVKWEPQYVVVDSPTPVEEDSQEATAVQEPVTGETVQAEDPGEKFIRLLKLILPHVKRALTTDTSVSEELKTRVREAQDLGRQRDFDQGLSILRMVGQLAKQAIAEAAASPPPDEATQSTPPNKSAETDRRQQWEQRLTQLEPRYNEAVRGSAPGADKMRIVMGYAHSQAQRQRFVKALVGLDRLERMFADAN